MSFETGIYQLLATDPGVSGIVSGRIFGSRVPDGATRSTYPCLVWQVVSTVDVHSLDGNSGLRMRRVQFDAYALKYQDAATLAEAVRDVFKNYIQQTLPDGTYVQGCVILNDQDFPYEPGATSLTYRRMLEVELTYENS